ncbi:TetR/AcrR family transcriptional regulator [Nonomuraea rhizosphaerae]|uniref:TetR/AcrR family transcriptional regulator n=1 Tax=Nonomuraea rhizosphaerae TaxID=2665663 RepID=UPI001C601601|nr:TetR/AcrR family transcriptional regulator [Nonomuraea rhizosphaerae]
MAVSARRGTPLTLEEIHDTALRLIGEHGVEGFSMRKLATELDVNPMSLYHHVENKTALITQICATEGARMELPGEDLPWPERLRRLAHAYRRLAFDRPNMWRYVHTHPEIIASRSGGLWDVLFSILETVGVPGDERRRTADVLYAFVSGLVFAETTGHIGDGQAPDEADRTFETAIDLIIRGLGGP